jgi:hypothetical protein
MAEFVEGLDVVGPPPTRPDDTDSLGHWGKFYTRLDVPANLDRLRTCRIKPQQGFQKNLRPPA